jgi:hypothetical protein
MRLLRLENDGGLSIREHAGKDIPAYAILSHTWGADDEEVTFKDLAAGTGMSKTGYRKLTFCAKQAAKDGLQWFWVDTCCIDKSSSAELSEAINSMFRYYRESAKCYVYLTDVSENNLELLRKSRWFTRGWTLQELIAPTCLELFSSEGERLGDRVSLMRQIVEITGIPAEAFGSGSLHQFSVDERMSWARTRETKREEDVAYSLLGIFDIHMPLLYGEGRNKALIRLRREIKESLRDDPPARSLGSATQAVDTAGKLNDQRISSESMETVLHKQQVADAHQSILGSLRYPHMQERRLQIHEAQHETYQWILHSVPDRTRQWDSLIAWLRSATDSRRIYWISGKPGAGKSTMMKFLDQNIIVPDHMLPWAEHKMVLSAQYFFWNPGQELQRSINGLLRALLVQLLEKQPHLTSQIVQHKKVPQNHTTDWTKSNLRHALHSFILSVRYDARVFLLLDGLDELDGSDDERDELIGFLVDMAKLDHVKICLSSRPWNIFRDAFGGFPQLRLEDLTERDISKYVEAQLSSHIRFQHLIRYDRMNAQSLISEITNKASGVFLWVRLVTRQLLQGLRDGDGIRALRKRLEGIPGDLYLYFRSLMDSIDPHQRQEASVFLQMALHQEDDFATAHPLRLIDLSFVDEGVPDFFLSNRHHFENLDLTNAKILEFRLDSCIRRLNSRCMGLLECHYEPGSNASTPTSEHGQYDHFIGMSRSQSFEPQIYHQIFREDDILRAHELTITFLHRSCRDFLFSPEVQDLLHQYTNGQYDARMYLLNSRVAQFVALAAAGTANDYAVNDYALGLASYIISSLARPSYRDTRTCVTFATAIQPMLEKVIQNYDSLDSYWYIYPSVSSWISEQSSFLTLAIDFGLVSYVKASLTPKFVQQKRGRPVLDYILRSRFQFRVPNLDLLGIILHFGADPNEMYGSASVWALFLCFLADSLPLLPEKNIHMGYSGAIKLLLRAGAATLLPRSWLSQATTHAYYGHFPLPDMSPDERFASRWPAVAPATRWLSGSDYEPLYAIGDLFRAFSPAFRIER